MELYNDASRIDLNDFLHDADALRRIMAMGPAIEMANAPFTDDQIKRINEIAQDSLSFASVQECSYQEYSKKLWEARDELTSIVTLNRSTTFDSFKEQDRER